MARRRPRQHSFQGHPKRTVLRALVRMRLDDAWALFRVSQERKAPQRRNGALYLAGYAVECALKATICLHRGTGRLEPGFFTHDLSELAQAAGLWPTLVADPGTISTFERVAFWHVALRYQALSWATSDVWQFLRDCEELTQWVSEN